MCARRSLNGVGQSGRLSEASLTDFMWDLQTFENAKSPFCCRCSPPCSSQSEWRSQVRSWSTAASKKKKIKWKYVFRIWTWTCQIHNFTCDFPPKDWKVSETSSSQCLLGNNNKKGAVVSEGHEGMADRRDYTVSQSVAGTNNLQLVWHKLTTPHHISVHSQQTLNNSPSAVKGSDVLKPFLWITN